MNAKLINDFYNKSTPEEKVQFLWLLAKDITVPVIKHDKKGKRYADIMELDEEIPVVLNGTMYQFNLEDLFEEDRKKEENKVRNN
tara:strand:+ start:136 stop:390 length:255 start_codon:yes stop_codon:yes gene_type:complete